MKTRVGPGKSPPGLSPGVKTSGFHGRCASGIASLRSGRLFAHGLPGGVASSLLVIATGCGTLPAAKTPSLLPVASRSGGRPQAVASRESADADPVEGDPGKSPAARGSWLSRSEWWARTKRQFARMHREIRADLDFHETEGLEGFGPDAVDQVKLMRSEMNGSGLIVP